MAKKSHGITSRPTLKPNSLDTSVQIDGTQPLAAGTSASIGNTDQADLDLAGTSSGDEENSNVTTGTRNEPLRTLDKYITPQGVITLNSDPSYSIQVQQLLLCTSRIRRRPLLKILYR